MTQELIKEINKVEQYVWDRVQSDYLFNNYGSFLYKILNYDQLILQIEKKIVEKKYLVNLNSIQLIGGITMLAL